MGRLERRVSCPRGASSLLLLSGRCQLASLSHLSPTRANEAPIANRVMTCLVQQSYNTTSTNGIPPTHTTEVVAALETPRDQDEHRLAPTTTHGRRCTHNPKVAGSNPAPATTKPLVDGNIRQGLLASPPRCLTVSLTGGWASVVKMPACGWHLRLTTSGPSGPHA